MRQTALRAALALCIAAFSAPARAGEGTDPWTALPAPELAARRAGLRVGGLDVTLEVWLRDSVDGRELASGLALEGTGVLVPLVNRSDGVRIEREAQIRVRIDGFSAVYGTPAMRAARARLRGAFE